MEVLHAKCHVEQDCAAHAWRCIGLAVQELTQVAAVCIHLCRHMCADMFQDVRIDVLVHKCTDMCEYVCADMCAAISLKSACPLVHRNIHGDRCRHVYRHLHKRAYRFVYGHGYVYMTTLCRNVQHYEDLVSKIVTHCPALGRDLEPDLTLSELRFAVAHVHLDQ